jgi:Patatin-like phospholipase
MFSLTPLLVSTISGSGLGRVGALLNLAWRTVISRAFWEDWVWGVTINGFCISLVLPVVLLLIVGLLFFDWGRGLGLPYLMRPEGPEGRTAFGRQLFVGLGVVVLIWQVFLAGYLAEEFATNYTSDHAPFCEVRDPLAPGALLDVDGFPGRFRYRPDDVWSIWKYIGVVTASAVALTLAGVPILMALVFVFWITPATFAQQLLARFRGDGPAPRAGIPQHPGRPRGMRWPYPLISWLALLAGMLVSAVLVTVVAHWLMRGSAGGRTAEIGEWLVRKGGKHGEAAGRIDKIRAAVAWRNAQLSSRSRRSVGDDQAATEHIQPRALADLARVRGIPKDLPGISANAGENGPRPVRRPTNPGMLAPKNGRAIPNGPIPFVTFQEAQKELNDLRNRATGAPTQKNLEDLSAWAQKEVQDSYEPYFPVFGLFVEIFLATLVFYLAATAMESLLQRFAPESRVQRWVAVSPAGWILFLLQFPLGWVTLMSYFSPVGLQFANLVLSGCIVFVGGHRYYKLRFPNFDADPAGPYLLPVRLETAYEHMNAAGLAARPSGMIPPAAVPYRRTKDGATIKPPIALVCVSGGGSRAAYWTMNVLAELERTFEWEGVAFPYHIRLVTGASGGMLAAAAYVASLEEPGNGPGPGGPLPQGVRRKSARVSTAGNTALDRLIEATGDDFLHDVARQLGWHDLRAILSPNLVTKDRGWTIEEVWRRSYAGILDQTFDDLRPGEEQGWRPSLIFSPMLVEDGRQLFISNLDLQRVTDDRARVLHPQEPPQVHQCVLSREGVEFFKLFPGARDTFKVGTAARMSASFPYVLPAAVLPTDPPRRVVDAGYYDNYGVGIAMSWLANHLDDWIRENTSGVVLIQIRDGASEESRRRWHVPDARPGWASRGLQWATTPPLGLWQSRQASQIFRNDNLIDVTSKLLQASGFPPDFFTTAIFEFDRGDDVSLSWKLIKRERDVIRAVFAPDGPLPEGGPPATVRGADALDVGKHRNKVRERSDAMRWCGGGAIASPRRMLEPETGSSIPSKNDRYEIPSRRPEVPCPRAVGSPRSPRLATSKATRRSGPIAVHDGPLP